MNRRSALFGALLFAILPGCNGGDGNGEDPPPGDGAFGAPCTTALDCESTFCADGPEGGTCTRLCDADCPEGYDCRLVITGTRDGPVQLCLPTDPKFCSVCSIDDQCAGGACLTLDGEGRCAPACAGEADCPDGYACAAAPVGERDGTFCQPLGGSCECTPALDGAVRTCSVSDGDRTCHGLETCVAGEGFVGCTAPTPADEVCDGTDNDCNGIIDDVAEPLTDAHCGACGNDCSVRIVNGTGRCEIVGGVPACIVDECDEGLVAINDYACAPPPDMSCSPCLSDQDCYGGRCVALDGETVCLSPCATGEDCREDYGCVTVDGDDLCVPDTQSCLCGPATHGLGRACVVENEAGLCAGTEVCDGEAGWQGCSAPAPTEEICDGTDNDCNGLVDDVAGLGDDCVITNEHGTCLGALACVAGETEPQCVGQVPAPESCNGLDDNCDGQVDEGFLIDGKYALDTHCGDCATDCTAIYDRPNATGHCDATGEPTCVMQCAPNTFDLNGDASDGCEFVLEDAIYVSVADPFSADDAGCGLGPVGTGAGHYPCRSLTQGLFRAMETSRVRVRVADGIYDEPIFLANGVDVLGGHRPDTWERDVANTATVVRGVSSEGDHDRTVIAQNVSQPTLFEGFHVRGPENQKPGGNAYAVYVSGSGPGLVIRGNRIEGGRGGPGMDGAAGSDGVPGVAGTGRDQEGGGAYDAFIADGSGSCLSVNDRAHENGGGHTCDGMSVSGGRGGGNRCAPVSGSQYSALDGVLGAGAVSGSGGDGGGGGWDGQLSGSNDCVQPPFSMTGADGDDGTPGTAGTANAGCTGGGTVAGGHWVGGLGGAGGSGSPGGGGGGGGAGGGAECDGCSDAKDRLGAHGGGGGSGGCGGAGGGGGGAGGGAFGLFIVGGEGPTVTGNVIVRGSGGAGGRGGNGGVGGPGGAGGAGGISQLFCAGAAGNGGRGGDGGHGAGGGGGCGGPSWGIFVWNATGAPDYCGFAADNTITGGEGGGGGSGGLSLANGGADGTPGVLGDCGGS